MSPPARHRRANLEGHAPYGAPSLSAVPAQRMHVQDSALVCCEESQHVPSEFRLGLETCVLQGCIDMCIEISTKVCMDMCMDMPIHKTCIHVHGHVYSHAANFVLTWTDAHRHEYGYLANYVISSRPGLIIFVKISLWLRASAALFFRQLYSDLVSATASQ